ncbi:MAG: DUF327 family protein [Treponema sp.]|jgi:uncharacterized protein YaaR (DUF327 family)|nr:DUF327 family protein [Treponema sp.]
MVKIDFPDTVSAFFSRPSGFKAEARKARDRSPQKVLFSGLLERITQQRLTVEDPRDIEDLPASEDTVRDLLDEIHSAGDDLKNRPLPEEIKRYKKAVKNFLRYVVKYGYTAEKQVSGANLLKRKNFTIVQVVDTKLEQLAAGILAGQTAQLDILHRLEEITGLLVDLMQ